MFRLDILQTQWLVVALAGGLILVLCMVLFYLAMWRRRPDADQSLRASSDAKKTGAMPWILILAYTFAVVFVVVYTFIMIRHPPNW